MIRNYLFFLNTRRTDNTDLVKLFPFFQILQIRYFFRKGRLAKTSGNPRNTHNIKIHRK